MGHLTLLTYFPFFENEYANEFMTTALWYVVPIFLLAAILITIRVFVKIPDFIFRKILHLVAIFMMGPLIAIPIHWWLAEIILGISGIGIIVILLMFEHWSFYQKLFIEKGRHEVLVSFIMFFTVMISLVAFFWGYRGDAHKYYILIAVLAWGVGDAAASIVGHLVGKHKLTGKLIEGVKSVEGTIACFVFSFAISIILLTLLIRYTWWVALIESILIGIVVSLAELFTKKGMDNVTCPLTAGVILFLFSLI